MGGPGFVVFDMTDEREVQGGAEKRYQFSD